MRISAPFLQTISRRDFLYINRWVLLLKCNNEAGMLVILQVACAVSANYLESGFYTEVIIHKYTNNQTINIKYMDKKKKKSDKLIDNRRENC